MSEPIDALRRKLAVYRVVLGALALLAGALLLFGRPGGRERTPDVRVIDLRADIAEIARTRSDVSDLARWYSIADGATVHMHLLGPRQIVPLHIHRKSHEATFIVSGTADVTHVFGARGSERRLTHAAPGALIVSPPLCGHAWKNVEPEGGSGSGASPRGVQANLVFEVPPFDGNFYLDDSDLARADGSPPVVYDLPAELADFARSGEQIPHRALAIAGGAALGPLPQGRDNPPGGSGLHARPLRRRRGRGAPEWRDPRPPRPDVPRPRDRTPVGDPPRDGAHGRPRLPLLIEG